MHWKHWQNVIRWLYRKAGCKNRHCRLWLALITIIIGAAVLTSIRIQIGGNIISSIIGYDIWLACPGELIVVVFMTDIPTIAWSLHSPPVTAELCIIAYSTMVYNNYYAVLTRYGSTLWHCTGCCRVCYIQGGLILLYRPSILSLFMYFIFISVPVVL